MKIVNFLEGQGSDDWLKWRRGGIGASDIPVIMGTNRYTTPLKLWNKKCGFESEDVVNSAIMHGVKNEGVARDWINENHNLKLEPICLEDEEHSHFRASLDGYDKDQRTLVEIKCPVTDSILDDVRVRQKVPEYWLDQIQWQIILCNPIRAMIAVWDYRYNSCVTIEAFCLPERQEKMKERAHDFWRKVVCGVQPEPQSQDYIVIETPELKELLKEYGELDKQEKRAQTRKKELKQQIIEQGDDGNFLSYGYCITRCMPKTTYDIPKMKMDGIDVDKYIRQSKSIGFYKINVPK